jgi:coproporphyrinogen III oxidase-like Fe-S oxidoreductase
MQSLDQGERPAREVEPLSDDVVRRERVMLGLRLDEPLPLAGLGDVIDGAALSRLRRLGLVSDEQEKPAADALSLTQRGRLLGGGVTADLLV